MSSTTEQQMNVESKLRACSIAKDNALQVVFHEETKAHDKEDELARNDRRINARHERDLENEQHDRDTKTRNVDYGHYLLDQIQEKEDKKQNAPHPFYNSTAFCEDYVDPVEKNRLKLQKQKEMRDGLDECVRQKNVFKRELEVVEAAEDEKRNEFLETQDNNTRRNEEQVKQRFEEREDRKNHAAMWRYENNGADAVNVEEPTKIFNTPEMMKIRSNIQERKAILEEMKKKVDDAFFKSDEDRKIIRKLTLEVQEEENKLEKLKNESQSQSSQ